MGQKFPIGIQDFVSIRKKKCFQFEFKLNGTAEEALGQIDSKDYLLPWSGGGKDLIKVGVSFDYEKRNIGEWKTAERSPWFRPGNGQGKAASKNFSF
jgi:hypothetical protein